MSDNNLKLNPAKIEFVFGPSGHRDKLSELSQLKLSLLLILMCSSILTSPCIGMPIVSAETVLYRLGNSAEADVILPLAFQYYWPMLSLAAVKATATHSLGA